MLFGAKFNKHLAKQSTRKGGAQSYPDVPAELEAGTPIFAKGEPSGEGPVRDSQLPLRNLKQNARACFLAVGIGFFY